MTARNAEVLEAYRQARRMGRKYVSERNSQGESGFLPLLEERRRELSSEIGLGLIEIPLKKIRGTYSAGRQSAMAGNFMPLLAEDTEFAGKWRAVLNAHLEEGLRDPVQAYEYLGYYYVREGNKRVSVLNYSKAYSITAEVTRLLPPTYMPDEDVRVFYEILGDNKRRPIRHLWFSRYGTFTKLRALAKEAGLSEEETFKDSFYRFRQAYHACGFTSLPLTTGDAFYEYARVYGFPLEITDKELHANLTHCEPQFILPDEDVPLVMGAPGEMEKKSAFSALFSKPHKLSVAFVYAGKPPRYLSGTHDAGRLHIARTYPHTRVRTYYTAADASDAYEVLSDAASERPDFLFSTDYYLESAALRVALEARGTLVLQCSASTERKALSTYYGNTAEAAYLGGVLAGALSREGRVGYIPGRWLTGTQPQDLQAFAQGAYTIRPGARVYSHTLAEQTPECRAGACAALAEAGCDIAWLPLLPNAPLELKHFPGVFAHLCQLSSKGLIERLVATAAWHWDAFYGSLLREVADHGPDLQNRPMELPLHFRMGLGTGLVDVHLVYPSLSPWVGRLYSHFHTLLSRGGLHPVDENMSVEIEELAAQ